MTADSNGCKSKMKSIQPFPPVTNHCKYECFSWLGFLMFFAMENQRQQTQMVVSQKWSQLLKAKRGEIQVWEQVSKLSPTLNARVQSINQCYQCMKMCRPKVFWSFILPGAVSRKQIFEDSASAGLLFCRWNIFWKRDWWPRPSEIQPFPPVTNHCKYECFSWLGFLMFLQWQINDSRFKWL